MPIDYIYDRHHSRSIQSCDSIEDAIYRVWADFETGEAWPIRLMTDNAQVLWEETGPMHSQKIFKEFAKKHNVQLEE